MDLSSNISNINFTQLNNIITTISKVIDLIVKISKLK